MLLDLSKIPPGWFLSSLLNAYRKPFSGREFVPETGTMPLSSPWQVRLTRIALCPANFFPVYAIGYGDTPDVALAMAVQRAAEGVA